MAKNALSERLGRLTSIEALDTEISNRTPENSARGNTNLRILVFSDRVIIVVMVVI